MKYYKGYPVVKGVKITNSEIKAKCPYCENIEHFSWNKKCPNPTRRKSHCRDGCREYYYIYLPKKKEVNENGNTSV